MGGESSIDGVGNGMVGTSRDGENVGGWSRKHGEQR